MVVAGLYAGDGELRFVVEDNGRGIPPSELETVVEFGHRGSNVTHVRAFGGGAGSPRRSR